MIKFSFDKKDRLLKRHQFLFLSKFGKKEQNKFFIVSHKKSDKIHLGITITKKVGKAVFRNKIKRIVREFFRLNKKNLEKQLDIVIIAKKEIAKLNSKEISFYVKDVFKKAKLLSER